MQIKSVFELMSEVMTFRFPTFSILEHIRKSQRDSRLYVYLQLRGCHRNPWLVVIWEDFQISNTKRAPSLSLSSCPCLWAQVYYCVWPTS